MMTNNVNIKETIRELVYEYFLGKEKIKFIKEHTRIPLNVPSYGPEEVSEAIDSLLTGQLTMGNKVKDFEMMFARYLGRKHAIMVNSGSSANLLALSVLTNPVVKGHIQPGDEVITPAITWATTVFPIVNCGAIPVLVDVDIGTFNIDVKEIEKAITDKTKAIMPVHLLGNPCDIQRIMEIAKARNLLVCEDACEAHGAEFNGRRVGGFGDLATFSFFFTHHISTIEGGMLLTDNDEYAELARSLRVFGWIRDLKDKKKIAQRFNDIDSRFLFINLGYNFRPTEIQGAFGIHQMDKLDKFIEIRRSNAKFWAENLKRYSNYLWLHEERKSTKHVWFGYPITISPEVSLSRKDLTTFLEYRGVETRPIMAGNMDEQPAMRVLPYRKVGELRNSRLIMRNSFFFGNHQGIGEAERLAIVDYFKEYMAKRVT